MNPTAIYSKSGKGVQEAAGKTSLLQRPDRAVLAAIDGRANLADVAQKVGKSFDAGFQKLIAQLDKDGFIREVSAGAGAPGMAKPAAAPSKPAAKPAGGGGDFGDLDFSSLGGGSKPAPAPSRPAAPPPPPPKPAAAPPSRPAASPAPPPAAAKVQTDALAKAREEAEAKAQSERERIRSEAEAKTRAEMEAKMREEAEKKMKSEALAKAEAAAKAATAEAEAKVKAARDAALKAAEAKVKAEAEAKAKLEAERKAREETERRLEEERKAREAAERKAKEEAERARKEAEEKARREAEELRRRLEEERKAREEAERKAKEEAERVRRELEEERKRIEAERKREEEERAARRKREEEEAEARRKQREEDERKAEEEREAKRQQREEEDRRADEERAAKRKQREEEDSGAEAQREAEREEREAKRKKEEEQAAALLAAAEARKAQPKKPESFGDSLLADLDSFSNRDEEERKAKEEEERKAKADAQRRRQEEAERQAKEEAERQHREEEEERRKVEEARRAREAEEQRAQEEERRKREAEEIRRKAAAATAAAMAKEGKGGPQSEDDIPISDDDLHMDEVKKEQAALAKTEAKEKEKEKERERIAAKAERKAEADSARIRKPIKWGKLITNTVIVLIVGGLIAVHLVPLSVTDYERSATEALGRPVKIGEARFWLLTGPQIRFSNVRVGDANISQIAAGVSPGSLFSDRKEFTRIEIDKLTLPQALIGDAIFATVKADNLVIDRIVIKSLELPGPAVMPKELQADAQLDGKGALKSATLHGPDGLVAKIVPKEGAVEFDVLAAGFTLPIAPEITLSKFGMKGSANPRGMKVDEWGGAIFNGGISGTASIRWGGTWTVEGVVTVRSINAAVFAPALVSNGTAEGTGRFTMTGSDPARLASTGRLEGNFTVTQGTLGSYDLAKGIQSSGKAAAGTTPFTEMTGQAVYDRGAVSLRNVTIGAGALNAAASADIAQGGALSGRIVADVKTANRSQQATIVLGGTVKEPQVRN